MANVHPGYKRNCVWPSIQVGLKFFLDADEDKIELRYIVPQDMKDMKTIHFPQTGREVKSQHRKTPKHNYPDFKFKVYCRSAFLYFRSIYDISRDDFIESLCSMPLIEFSNPGAGGASFWLSQDYHYILKSVTKGESKFLRKFLPSYYNNFLQNPYSLLPRYFFLFKFHSQELKNTRVVIMNNILDAGVKFSIKYDLKGSTKGRRASQRERRKDIPTLKDLDFREKFPKGIILDSAIHTAFAHKLESDTALLQQYNIMDYSLLLAVYQTGDKVKGDLHPHKRRKKKNLINMNTMLKNNQEVKLVTTDEQAKMYNEPIKSLSKKTENLYGAYAQSSAQKQKKANKNTPKVANYNANAISNIFTKSKAQQDNFLDSEYDAIPAIDRNTKEKIVLVFGIIDVLQTYRTTKKLEHYFKTLRSGPLTISVCPPKIYMNRFKHFLLNRAFVKKSQDVDESTLADEKKIRIKIQDPEISGNARMHSSWRKCSKRLLPAMSELVV